MALSCQPVCVCPPQLCGWVMVLVLALALAGGAGYFRNEVGWRIASSRTERRGQAKNDSGPALSHQHRPRDRTDRTRRQCALIGGFFSCDFQTPVFGEVVSGQFTLSQDDDRSDFRRHIPFS